MGLRTGLAIVLCIGVAGICASGGSKTEGKGIFGAIDNPPGPTEISGLSYFVLGGALAEGGVDHVSIYLDGTYLQDAVLTGRPRPDVLAVYPQFAGATESSYVTELRPEILPVGRHKISARVFSKEGMDRELEARAVFIHH